MKRIKRGRSRFRWKVLSLFLSFSMLLTIQEIPTLATTLEAVQTAAETRTISLFNPVHHCTNNIDTTGDTDTTEWDYVYFGSYPQTEVTGDKLTKTILEANYDENGDAWIEGIKYRRISRSDANYNGYFGSSDYRYFKWERIKWRVLDNDGSSLFLVADYGLDCKNYNEDCFPVVPYTWENCTLRNWLNSDFYRTAFSSEEQKAIIKQSISNKDNSDYKSSLGNSIANR